MIRIAFAIVLTSLAGQQARGQPAPIDIGSRLELFVDAFLIDRLDNARLVLHHPTLAPPSPAPPSDGHYATVIKDGAIYRLYNRGGYSGFDGDPKETTEYFESHDGIHWERPNVGLYEIEGKSSVQAGYESGEMITRPLVFSGDELTLNVATSAGGQAIVELLDAAGTPIPGYSAKEADRITADAIAYTVSWKGHSNIHQFAGQAIRIRFILQEADLYAVQFR